MDTARLPEIIQEMYRLIDELERMFEGRHFTPDGHTVGSIGEAIAAHYYGLKLLPASTKGRDATIGTRSVEIKVTQGDSIALRHEPEHLLVLKLRRDGTWSEVYNGPGKTVWSLVRRRPLPKNGQYQVRCGKLQKLMENVPADRRLPRTQA
ncbi:MAG: hypothetical protein KBI32_04755 [Phycisphaerae bacterium]|nr:hypothetical protein [Phycisphaerae bacterium]